MFHKVEFNLWKCSLAMRTTNRRNFLPSFSIFSSEMLLSAHVVFVVAVAVVSLQTLIYLLLTFPSSVPFIYIFYSFYSNFSVLLLLFFIFQYVTWKFVLYHIKFISISRLLQGICPGNRLKIILSSDAAGKPSSISSPSPSMPSIHYNNSILSSADSILYENTIGYGPATSPTTNHLKHGKRRSWHIMPNKVLYYYFIYQNFFGFIINQKSSSHGMLADGLGWDFGRTFIWSYAYTSCSRAFHDARCPCSFSYKMKNYELSCASVYMYLGYLLFIHVFMYGRYIKTVYSQYACLFVHWILFDIWHLLSVIRFRFLAGSEVHFKYINLNIYLYMYMVYFGWFLFSFCQPTNILHIYYI